VRLEGKELWSKFITFREIPNQLRRNQTHVYSPELPGEVRNNISCFFCGENDHTLTNGPGNSKIVQYFVCKKIVEMTPAQRFYVLKSKDFVFNVCTLKL